MTIATALPRPAWAHAIASPSGIGDPKSILIYGFPGRRKTSISGSIMDVLDANGNFKFKKALFIDIDNGSEVLANHPAVIDGRIEVLPINSLDPNSLSKLLAVIDDVTTTNYGYDVVILDTVDVAQDAAEKSYNLEFATSGKGGTRDGFAVFGALGTWTDEICRKLHNCPWLLGLVVAHSNEPKESNGYRYTAKLSGSSKEAIASIFSIVMFVDFAERPDGSRGLLATVGESPFHITKNRYGLPMHIGDVTMPILYGMIEAGATKPSASALSAAA